MVKAKEGAAVREFERTCRSSYFHAELRDPGKRPAAAEALREALAKAGSRGNDALDRGFAAALDKGRGERLLALLEMGANPWGDLDRQAELAELAVKAPVGWTRRLIEALDALGEARAEAAQFKEMCADAFRERLIRFPWQDDEPRLRLFLEGGIGQARRCRKMAFALADAFVATRDDLGSISGLHGILDSLRVACEVDPAVAYGRMIEAVEASGGGDWTGLEALRDRQEALREAREIGEAAKAGENASPTPRAKRI